MHFLDSISLMEFIRWYAVGSLFWSIAIGIVASEMEMIDFSLQIFLWPFSLAANIANFVTDKFFKNT